MTNNRKIKIGQSVIFYDGDGNARDALITYVHSPDCINVVCISEDVTAKDSNGRLPADNFTSVQYEGILGVHGYCFGYANEECSAITVGSKVVVSGSERHGTIIGIWEELGGAKQYKVRYFDSNGCANSTWFYDTEFTLKS